MKNLLKLRRNAGLSQQALASRFHLSQQTIYKYENGLAEPDINTLIRLAKFFDVTVDYLIGNTAASQSDELPAPEFTSEERAIISKMRKLNPSVRIALNAFLDNLTLDQ